MERKQGQFKTGQITMSSNGSKVKVNAKAQPQVVNGQQQAGRLPRTLAIIQARISSVRLPGKVLLDIEGQPMLARVYERARRARAIAEVVVATTMDPSDNAVEDLCQSRGYLIYRGSTHDVLDRYYQAAREFGADVIVRLTADCPLMDPGIVDLAVQAFLGKLVLTGQGAEEGIPSTDSNPRRLVLRDGEFHITGRPPGNDWDFTATRLPPPWKRTFPIGLDVEVCSFEALERAWREADQPHQREHVMPYLYEQEGRFRVLVLDHEPDYGAHRWTVDTAEDLELVRRIFAHFQGRDDFSWIEVLDLFERHPELSGINAAVQHKSLRD
jgi:spore coat polysaccharide biosynthesis protein SpsF